MPADYPEVIPEIRMIKKRGLQSAQLVSIQHALVQQAQASLGTEMIFDLIEKAKELLNTACNNKRVSFHDQMIARKAIELVKEKIESSDESSEDIEVDLVVTEEINRKTAMLRIAKEERGIRRDIAVKVGDIIRLDDCTAVSGASIPSLTIVEPLPQYELGDVFSACDAKGNMFTATLIRFECKFYCGGSTQGQKRFAAGLKKIHDYTSQVGPSAFIHRLISLHTQQVKNQQSKTADCIDMWLISEPCYGVPLVQLLSLVGTVNFIKAVAYTRSLLQALVELHSMDVAHQGNSLSFFQLFYRFATLQYSN